MIKLTYRRENNFWKKKRKALLDTAWKVSKYRVFPGLYFPYSHWLQEFSPTVGKYGPERTPHWDTFQAVTTISLSLKYNSTLPKIKEIVMKHWHLPHINPNLTEIFQNPPNSAFCRNKVFRDIWYQINRKRQSQKEICKQHAR